MVKSLISINHKFMGINPKKLVMLISNSKHTNGVEAYIDFNKQEEVSYLSDLVFELKKYNLILQVHGDIDLDYNLQLEYLKVLERYSDYLGYSIVVTFHTIYDENEEVSKSKTLEYLSSLISAIDNSKIIVCLENLNDVSGFMRLEKEKIESMILNDEKLYFTYDIGHEIADYGSITNLDNYMIEEIRNVHIHSNNGRGVDHMPIYKNDIHWNEIMKGILFLITHNYKYNIVFEYGLEYCNGNTVEEKVMDYLCSIDYVSERNGGNIHE